MYGPRRFSIRDVNGVLDQAATVDQATRVSFLDCLERVTSHDDPLDDPHVELLRDPEYEGGYTATFDNGILVFSGPHFLPPVAFIEVIDVAWLDDDDEDDR